MLSHDPGESFSRMGKVGNRLIVKSIECIKEIAGSNADLAAGIKQVSDAIEKISDMAHQIARATGEQRSGSEQINRAAARMKEMTRFVKGATTEQVKAVKKITKAVEPISAKIGLVRRTTGEVRTGRGLTLQAIGQIKSVAKGERCAGRSVGRLCCGCGRPGALFESRDRAVQGLTKESNSSQNGLNILPQENQEQRLDKRLPQRH